MSICKFSHLKKVNINFVMIVFVGVFFAKRFANNNYTNAHHVSAGYSRERERESYREK